MGKLKSTSTSTKENPQSTNTSVERIVLRQDEGDKIDRWLAQLNEKYDSLVKFSKSDLANFLVRHHDETLSESEMNILGAEMYDELRWVNRALEKVRQAKRSGTNLNLEDLMMKRKPLEKIKMSLLKRDKNQRKQGAHESLHNENEMNYTSEKVPES